MRVLSTSIILLAFASVSIHAYAEPTTMYRVGAAVKWDTEVYRGAGNDVMALPYLYLKHGAWELDRTALKYYLIEIDKLKLAPILSFELDGYDADDSSFLAGMENRDFSLGLGIAAEYDWSFLDIKASVRRDVLNNSDGLIAELSVGTDFIETPSYAVGLELGLSYYDSHYSDYYYGVLATEATAGRPAYEVDSTLNPSVQLGGFYRLNQNWAITGIAKHTFFDSNIKDSPIIDANGETTFILGVAYQGFF